MHGIEKLKFKNRDSMHSNQCVCPYKSDQQRRKI